MNDAPNALPPPPPESRLHQFVSSFGHLVGTLIDMGFTRLELVFVELQEWIEGLVQIFFWAMVMIFAAAVFLLLGAFTLIFVFWDHRVLVAAVETGAFALLMLSALAMMKRRVSAHRSLLATTLAEFAKDRELFKRSRTPAPVSTVSPGSTLSPASVQAPPL